MKQIIFGDIHGRTIWKDILNFEKDWDRVIFIGDYLDSRDDISGNDQATNLMDIIQFKKQNPDNVILLIGNHDYHYWPGITENYSGYEPKMRPVFEHILDDNKNLFQMCFMDEQEVVYSHAGFTETFLEKKIGTKIPFDPNHVNDVWKYKPQNFEFYPYDRSYCGDNINQSCIWVRPQSLYNDRIDNLQVVGHTSVLKINHPEKSNRRGFYLIDALEQRYYLVKQDEQFIIKQFNYDKQEKNTI